MDEDKIKLVLDFSRPQYTKKMHKLLGIASWIETQEYSFIKIKEHLTTTPILACPDFRQLKDYTKTDTTERK